MFHTHYNAHALFFLIRTLPYTPYSIVVDYILYSLVESLFSGCFHRRPKKQRFPKLPCLTAHLKKLWGTTATKFTKQTYLHHNVTHWAPLESLVYWRPLTVEHNTHLSSRRPAEPIPWCCPNLHHKFLKTITPFTIFFFISSHVFSPVLLFTSKSALELATPTVFLHVL